MNKKIRIIDIFLIFIRQYPFVFIRLFLFLIIEGIAAGMSMLAIIPLADFFIDPSLLRISKVTKVVIQILHNLKITPSFWVFGLLFIILNLLKGVIEVFIKYAILKIKYSITSNLFTNALKIFFKAKWNFFSTSDNGVLLNTLNKELNTIGDTIGQIATLLAQIVQLIIFLTVPFLLNWKLTSMILFLSFIMAIPFLFLNKLSYNLGKKNTETSNKAHGVLSEILQGAKLILGFGKQDDARYLFMKEFDNHVKVTLRSQTLTVAIPKIFQPLALVAVVISIGFAINQNNPISEVTGIMWSFIAALPIISSLVQGNISIKNFLPSYEQLNSLQSKALKLEEIEGEINFSSLVSNIKLDKVNFKYDDRDTTLCNINLLIPKGKMVAIIGESGSGKSTITDLILGLQVPNSGQIIIDDIPLSSYHQNSFRKKIGYVPQDSMLFNTTIKENLLWSFDLVTDMDIWNALDLANASNFIKELPNGINTIVGDRGVRLSGGQRQRIALARALIRKPELLILDEATSALDTESELLIQKSIENVAKETTILIIAHRLSTISKADIVYVLSKGKIIEEGSFASLSFNDSSFLYQMLKNQKYL